MRSTSEGLSLDRLAVPARRPLTSTSTWLRKSRPWPSVEAPRRFIEVWAAVHSLRKPTAFSASRSVTERALERSMASRSMVCVVPAMRLRASGRAVAVTKTASSASSADAPALPAAGSCAAPAAAAQQASTAAAVAGRRKGGRGKGPEQSAAKEAKRMR